jgi:hypothetical protein
VQAEAGADRKQVPGKRDAGERQQGAGGEPGDHRGEGDQPDLHRIDAADVGRGRAEHLQRGDALALALEIRADAVADADPGDDEGGEADQAEELAHARKEAARAGRGIVAVADLPARRREGSLEPLRDGCGCGARRQAQAIAGGEQAAGLDEAGSRKSLQRGDGDRPEREAFPDSVGLFADQAGDAEVDVSEANAVAAAQGQAVGKLGRDEDVAGAGRARRAAVDAQCAIERINGIDSLQFGEHRFVAAARHRPQPYRRADCARGPHRGQLGGRGLALVHADLHVAAEDHLAARCDLARDGGAEAADRSQSGDSEEHAQEEQPQAREAAVEVAAGEGGGGAPANRAHAASRSEAMRPSCISTMRAQRSASETSWVIITKVAPLSAWRANNWSMIAAPVALSRLPVGSSAKTIAGPGATARAIATRCCSPPDSSAG